MKELTLEVTQRCNLNCLHCSSCASSSSSWELDINLLGSLIDEIITLGYNRVNISGGEPFLYSGLWGLVSLLGSSGIEVWIYTSGVGEANSYSDLYLLRRLGLQGVVYNFPAFDKEKYNALTGTFGNQSELLSSISYAQRAHLGVELNVVPNKINLSDLDVIIDYARTQNIQRVNILALVLQGRALGNKDLLYLSKEEQDFLSSLLSQYTSDPLVRIGDSLRKDNICKCGVSKLVIRYDGYVFGCEAFKHHDTVFSPPLNIYTHSLSDILSISDYLSQERNFCQRYAQGCPIQESQKEV